MLEKLKRPLMINKRKKIKKKPSVLLKLKMKTKLVLPPMTPLLALLSQLLMEKMNGVLCKE